jgi:hypothetical protein
MLTAEEVSANIWKHYQAQLFHLDKIFSNSNLDNLFSELGAFTRQHISF